MVVALIVSLLACVATLDGADPSLSTTVPANSEQCLLVLARDWTSSDGLIRLFQRDQSQREWREPGFPQPVVLGKAGLAWGRGLIDTSSLPGPRKKEGDGKSPAGVFRLVSAFGYERTCNTKLPYLALTPDIEAIDDPQSHYYNQIVNRSQIRQVDWRTSEHMLRADDLYKWGIVVGHNIPAQAAAGSCIFLHVWDNPKPTVGCTAMSEAQISNLIKWLDPNRHPILVQLPGEAYSALHARWNLPPLR